MITVKLRLCIIQIIHKTSLKNSNVTLICHNCSAIAAFSTNISAHDARFTWQMNVPRKVTNNCRFQSVSHLGDHYEHFVCSASRVIFSDTRGQCRCLASYKNCCHRSPTSTRVWATRWRQGATRTVRRTPTAEARQCNTTPWWRATIRINQPQFLTSR